jgi:hypothetical protein
MQKNKERKRAKRVVGRNDYKVGERVWVKAYPATNLAKGKTSKISPKRLGPYKITAIINEQTIEILREGKKVENVANMSRYVERPEWMKDADESEEEEIEEAITGSKQNNEFEREDQWGTDFGDEEYVDGDR